MKSAIAEGRQLESGLVRLIRAIIEWLAWLAHFIAPPVLRIALAVPFFNSGLTKWDGFLSLSPATQYLFQNDFQLHVFGSAYPFPAPDVAAYLSASGEIVFPILLVIGLGTRFAALGMLAMTAVIQLVEPSGWANFHLPWASMALAIIALGPGPLSLDHFIDQYFRRAPGR